VRGDKYVADCRLPIVDWKNKNWIPACAGMTREQESEIRARARIEIICRGGSMCPPVLLKRPCVVARKRQSANGNRQLEFPLPCGERIKVRGR